MKKKKRVKVLLVFAFVLVVFFGSVVSSSATEYGETPFDVISSWTEYNANVRPNPVEQNNPFTLVINVSQTSSIDFWFNINQISSQNYPVNWSIHIDYGTIWINEGQADEQTVSTGIMLIPFYWIDTNPWDIFNDTSEGYVLNNQQLVTMQTYTATQAEVEASFTDGVQSGIQQGLRQGRQEGYDLGYTAGYDTANADNQFGTAGAQLITAVVEAPVNVFSNMLNFEILGVNVFGLVVALLSFGLVFAILKRVL